MHPPRPFLPSHPPSAVPLDRIGTVHRDQRRRAFTLVELLVVLAIIGLMMGVMLPAVQAAREAMRGAQCRNNLKQIGLAMQNYHTTYQTLPWGAKGGWGHSWTTDILPFIDENGLWEKTPQGEPGSAIGVSPESRSFQELARVALPTYRCPSQIGPAHRNEVIDLIAGRAHNSYVGNAGSDVDRDDYSLGAAIGMEAGNGVLRVADFVTRPRNPQPESIQFRAILDGLSHTVMVSETRYFDIFECATCDHFALYHPDFDQPVFDRAGNLRQGSDFSEALATLRYGINLEQAPIDRLEMSIGSLHPAGVHVLLCDGSVQYLNESFDDELRHALGSRADRENYDQTVFD